MIYLELLKAGYGSIRWLLKCVLLDSSPRRTENRDFLSQKMKSRYGFRIVTKVFLDNFESFKPTFVYSTVPKRIST